MEKIVCEILSQQRDNLAQQEALETFVLCYPENKEKSTYEACCKQTDTVNCWLAILQPSHRFVVQLHYIEGNTWDQIQAEYEKANPGEDRSARQLRYYQEVSIRKIAKFVEDNYDLFRDVLDHFTSQKKKGQ